MKTLIIVKAGNTFPELAAGQGDFEQWIAAGIAPLSVPVTVIDPRGGAELPAADTIAGAIVTGSHAMVTERAAWSEALAAWLRDAAGRNIPVLGICFGHQLLAHALGGEVGYRPDGIRIGTVAARLTTAASGDPLFGDLPAQFPVQVVHRQSVMRLPEHAIVLAGDASDAHQAFRVGEAAWGVQFHPEFSSAAMRGYIEHLAPDLRADGCNVPALLDNVAATGAAASILRKFGVYVGQRQTQLEAPAAIQHAV
jgi:GMP synthase (glutamine-hydrolysing)